MLNVKLVESKLRIPNLDQHAETKGMRIYHKKLKKRKEKMNREKKRKNRTEQTKKLNA